MGRGASDERHPFSIKTGGMTLMTTERRAMATRDQQDEGIDINRWMGVQLVEAREGRAVVRVRIKPHHCHGEEGRLVVTGGLVLSMMDYTVHEALTSVLGHGQAHGTVEMKLNFIRPGVPGTLRAEAVIVNKGRRLAVLEGTVVQEDSGKIVAKALSTEAIVETADGAGNGGG